jgi:hypothetical protein
MGSRLQWWNSHSWRADSIEAGAVSCVVRRANGGADSRIGTARMAGPKAAGPLGVVAQVRLDYPSEQAGSRQMGLARRGLAVPAVFRACGGVLFRSEGEQRPEAGGGAGYGSLQMRRRPRLVWRESGGWRWRLALRRASGSLNQLPPRMTRSRPEAGPWGSVTGAAG